MSDRIIFETEDGESVELAILDEITVDGKDYILVTEDEEGDNADDQLEVMILRAEYSDEASEDDEMQSFETVEDDDELEKVSEAFAKQLAQDDIELEFK